MIRNHLGDVEHVPYEHCHHLGDMEPLPDKPVTPWVIWNYLGLKWNLHLTNNVTTWVIWNHLGLKWNLHLTSNVTTWVIIMEHLPDKHYHHLGDLKPFPDKHCHVSLR